MLLDGSLVQRVPGSGHQHIFTFFQPKFGAWGSVVVKALRY